MKGLVQELHRTRFHGLHRHRNISVTGDEDNRDLQARVRQLSLKLQAINSWQANIQDQTTRPSARFLRKNSSADWKDSHRNPADFNSP